MKITCDATKRQTTLSERGLDFFDARQAFAGSTLTLEDDRQDYGEIRYQTLGLINDRLVMIVWTPRAEARHVFSMRFCNDRERRKFRHQLR